MNVDALLARRHKMRYFEGYSETAMAKAVLYARKQYAKGLAGPNKEAFALWWCSMWSMNLLD